jgi:predicted Zn-dependent protease
MSRPVRWTAAALVVAAAACSDIATPIRNDFYEWRLVVPKASGTGEDSLAFHWPKSRIPVRIWVEDAASLPQNVPNGIAAWRTAYLYHEFDATVVSDSGSADVIVRAGSAPGVQFARQAGRAPGDRFARMRLNSALAPECAGATDLDISDDHTQLRLPVRVYVDSRSDPTAPGLPACLALTTTHELGHALGIWRHSEVATDLMFFDPGVDTPSDRDLATAEMIYHLPANVEPVGP